MRIAIFGAGGVGGYFGGRLAQSGHEVVFIARGEHLRALRSRGLRVDSVKGDFILPTVAASDRPAEVGAVDVVILAVKTWQVQQAAQAMRPLVGDDTVVLPLMNGVEAPSQLAEVLGPSHVLGGLAKIISLIAGPGHIRHLGAEPYIALGELDDRRSERVDKLRQALADAGIMVETPADFHAALWGKFLFVVSWGGPGAVTRAPIGVLRSVPQTRGMLEQAMDEVLAVARARRIILADDIVAQTMAFIDSLPPSGTTSLQRDIAEGRPSELDAWNGAVVRLGAQAGVTTPLHGFIYASLLPQESRARGSLAFPD